MLNIYDYLEYREIVRDQAAQLKKERAGWTLQRIATRAQVQAPYLTNVLKERAHLQADQLYALAQIFEWDEEQTDYVQLLLEHERSANPQRKQVLAARIQSIRQQKLQTKSHLKAEAIAANSDEHLRLFLNPFNFLVYSLMAVPRFAKDPRRITRCLSLDFSQVQAALKELENTGFVKKGKDGWEKQKKSFHLPKESPLCGPHQDLLRQQMFQHSRQLPEEEKYTFTVNFSADAKIRESIQREFLKFLKAIEPLAKAAPSEELYGLSFELFRWSFEKQND